MTRDEIIELAIKAGFSLRESFVRTELRYEKDGESCARKHQMERDDDTRWFPMVSAKPDERGRCNLHIREGARDAS